MSFSWDATNLFNYTIANNIDRNYIVIGNGSFSVGHNTISTACNAGSSDEIPIKESQVIGTILVANTIRHQTVSGYASLIF